MNPSRRAFIQTAAALPAAGLVAGAGLGEAVVVPESVATGASPYTTYPWQWFVSHDGEIYQEVFDTKEEAVDYAKKCEYSIVAECQQRDFDIRLDGWDILESLNEGNEELIGEGEGIECTQDQMSDLETMVNAAIEAWVLKHKISITAWTFGDVRNKIEIDQIEARRLHESSCSTARKDQGASV